MTQLIIAIVAWCSTPSVFVGQKGEVHPLTVEMERCKTVAVQCMAKVHWKASELDHCLGARAPEEKKATAKKK